VRPPDGDPSGIAWLLGLLGLMLPWIAVPLGGAGLLMALRGNITGWWLLGGGVGLLAVDLLISLAWGRRSGARSDQPLLNQRGAQYIGRNVCVVEAIVGGEGKVRVADTVWRARGADCGVGTWVRVIGVDGPYLLVSEGEAGPRSRPEEP
jgi:inner membrane protein